MAEMVAAVAAKAASWATATFINITGSSSLAAAQTVYATAYAVTYAGVTLGVAYGINRLTAPAAPAISPPRQTFMANEILDIGVFGRRRVSGGNLLREASKGTLYQVIYLATAESLAVEKYWLHDDAVTLNASQGVVSPESGGYPKLYRGSANQDYITLDYRLGTLTQTAFARSASALSGQGLWSGDHRGRGLTLLEMTAAATKAEHYNTIYAYGRPEPSVLLLGRAVFDPRDPSQNPGDPASWTRSGPGLTNLVLQYLTWLIAKPVTMTIGSDEVEVPQGGPEFDYATAIAPSVEYWKSAADVADLYRPLRDGGQERLYHGGLAWNYSQPHADTDQQFRQAMDASLHLAGDGSLILRAGRYEEPAVTLTDAHILDSSVPSRKASAEGVNILRGEYISAAHDYTAQPYDEWVDAADVAARGGEERVMSLSFPAIETNSHARYVAKRIQRRENSPVMRLRTTLYGRRCRSERFVRIKSSRPGLQDIVVEIVGRPRTSYTQGCVYLDAVVIDPETYDAWNPATEEGAAPGEAVPGENDITPQLTIESVTPILETGGSDTVQAADVVFDLPTFTADSMGATLVLPRQDLTYLARWRTSADVEAEVEAGAWSETLYFADVEVSGASPDFQGTMRIQPLPVGSIDIQIAAETPVSGQGAWSDVSTVDISSAETPADPDPETGGTV